MNWIGRFGLKEDIGDVRDRESLILCERVLFQVLILCRSGIFYVRETRRSLERRKNIYFYEKFDYY